MRYREIRDTFRHKKAILKIASGLCLPIATRLRLLWHDMDKAIMTLVVGDALATKVHRYLAKHHRIIDDVAIIDWASAMYTKPNKRLDAYDTARVLKGVKDLPILARCRQVDEVANKIYNRGICHV